MVWLDSSPTFQVPYLEIELPLSIHLIPNTPVFAVLTPSSVSIYHQYTLLPLATHKRTIESITQHGYNSSCQIQLYSVNYSKLQQATHVNIFINSSNTHLILYLVVINYSKSFFQVLDPKTDELLQKGLPVINTHALFSFTSLLKAATRSIINGTDHSTNIENIEHFNNFESEDESNNFTVPYVKLSVLKILKVSIGIEKFWLRHNSHNLFIFSQGELQIINVKLFNNEVYKIEDFNWYESESPVKYIQFNEWFNYFLFINDDGELWYMSFINDEKNAFEVNGNVSGNDSGDEQILVGFRILDNIEVDDLDSLSIEFNPQFNLFLLHYKETLKLYRIEVFETLKKVTFIKEISHNVHRNDSSEANLSKLESGYCVNWSLCGEFFTLSEKSTSNWLIFTRFGKCTFNSSEISMELTINQHSSNEFKFLKSGYIMITPNSKNLILIDSKFKMIYLIDLLTHQKTEDPLIFTSNDYISIFDAKILEQFSNNSQLLIKLPILPLYKGICRRLTYPNNSIFNLNTSPTGKNCLPGKLTILVSSQNQLSFSYGDNISISTPYLRNNKVNHVLWFNFHNYYQETLNIIDHFWYDDYLVLINRAYKDELEELVDEIIILNVGLTKFATGGVNVKFDSEMIVWRYNLKQLIISHQFQKKSTERKEDEDQEYDTSSTMASSSSSFIVVTNDMKILIFKFSFCPTNSPQLFIGLSKTIFLKTISQKLLVKNISQINLIDDKHFLILLNTGDFYLLKNQEDDANVYDLILINNCVDYFRFKKLFKNNETFLYLSTGSTILIFSLTEIVEYTLEKLVYPILIKMDELFQPLLINSSEGKSIELLGLENFATYKNKYLILKTRINHNLILNNFIEYDLVNGRGKDLKIFDKYETFKNFHYCLELLLYKYLTNMDDESPKSRKAGSDPLKRLINLIDSQPGSTSESIYINCLRKIEVGYWYKFFDTLETTPLKFMNKLILIGEVELCYNYLIIYLNFKKEYEVHPTKEGKAIELLDSQDQQIILSIIKMLDKAERWDWCFELCRFIKLLEPTSELLKIIKKEVDV